MNNTKNDTNGEAILIKKLRQYARDHNLSIRYIAKLSSYTEAHVCWVLSGKAKGSKRFIRNLLECLAKQAKKNVTDLKELVQDTEWENIL